ncbi:MAG: hypothetical protein U0Y68_10165 [Blastocatellia bacterium]
MEWLEEYAEREPTHRHVSHLWDSIRARKSRQTQRSDLAAAARKSLEQRGDLATGWSLAHKLNFWARRAMANARTAAAVVAHACR